MKDMTFRAVDILNEVDLILAEDTRVSAKLLQAYDIRTPVRSFHAHNEHKVLDGIIQKLKEGNDLAIISDAGMPGISDPGFLLIRACIKEGIVVDCLPGPTAFVNALVLSGFPMDKFHFEGFLPAKKGRQTRWTYLASLPDTIVLYESPHKIGRCMDEAVLFLGERRRVCICRELTKIHQECIRGTALEVRNQFEARGKLKGEIVVVIDRPES